MYYKIFRLCNQNINGTAFQGLVEIEIPWQFDGYNKFESIEAAKELLKKLGESDGGYSPFRYEEYVILPFIYI